jgi:positive regulator of sigma E activity
MSPSGCASATGTVVGMSSDGLLEIEFLTPPRCRGCEGLCMWRRLPATQRATLASRVPLTVGQRVVVTLPEHSLLAGAVLVYGVPLGALLLGAVAGAAITGSEVVAAAGAVLSVLAVLLVAPWLRRGVERLTLRSIDVRPADGNDDAQARSL